ncbi:MAG: hypothetical protein V4772_07310 [Pseudomonadota bacterium]
MSSIKNLVYRGLWAYLSRSGMVLFCCDDGPDTSGQVATAQASERVGMRQLDLAEKKYASDQLLQDELLGMTRAGSASDLELKRLQMDLAQDQADRRKSIFNPLEDGLVNEARQYDSTERVQSEMGKADAAVVQAYDKALRSSGRDLLRMGVNPNSAKSLALRENANVDLALGAAGASTSAGRAVKEKGFGMRMDVAGLGRNLSTNQTAAANSAIAAGQSSIGGFQGAVDQGNRNFNSTQQGFGGANSAFGTAGNLYGSAASATAAADAADSQGVGSLIGTGAMIFL